MDLKISKENFPKFLEEKLQRFPRLKHFKKIRKHASKKRIISVRKTRDHE